MFINTPWSVCKDNENAVRSYHGFLVGETRWQCNARLLAAAPDLYNALLRVTTSGKVDDKALLGACVSALVKATGGNPMTAQELRAWRKRLKLTQSEAATHLGVSKRVFQYWESGEREIPRLVELATRCEALDATR